MKRTIAILVGVMTCITSYGGESALAIERSGYFYVVEGPLELDRLYRVDFDGTVTPIGREGQLAYPAVDNLIWNWGEKRLFGLDRTLRVWLEINPSTGRATSIGPLDVIIDGAITYNSIDGNIYMHTSGTDGFGVYSIDTDTAMSSFEFSLSGGGDLAHIVDTTGGITGFATTGDGLTLYNEPDYQRFIIGGDGGRRRVLMWNPKDDELYSTRKITNSTGVHNLYLINQVTGNETLLVSWELPISIYSITFVPDYSINIPICTNMDNDNDGDIDLMDYADFQNCMSGSKE